MKIMAHPLKEASSDGGTSTSLKFCNLVCKLHPARLRAVEAGGLPVTFAEWVTASVKG
jgi:hypothetical protein